MTLRGNKGNQRNVLGGGEADSWNKLVIKLDVQYSQKDKDE